MVRDTPFMTAFDRWTDQLTRFVASKGKVEPGQWLAIGYEAPGHRWAGEKLKWSGLRIGMGHPPAGASPAEQERLGLNDDATLHTTRTEGEKFRE